MSFRYSRPLSGSGLGVEVLSFSFQTGASPSVIRDGGGNLVASVSRPTAGNYTVQFEKPYPIQMVACADPTVHQAAGATSRAHVNVPHDTGYNATAGTLQLQVVVDDGTPAIEDPAASSRISFIGVFRTFGATFKEA